MSIEQIIISSSYIGIFLLLILNGIFGFPSSQIIYIIAGWFAYSEDMNLLLIVLLGGIGHAIGNAILYEISRKKGLNYILKFKLIPKSEICKVNAVMQKKGYWFLFFGKFVNPIKIILPIPCGISKMNRFIFNSINVITTILWAIIFVSIGYIFGKSWDFAYYYGVIMIILSFSIMFIFYRYMNSQEILKLVK
ncbi:MAG: DedA family protein [Nanoarchaeota archaeon]